MHDLKTVSNDKIGTHFVLTGNVIVDTSLSLDTTGAVLENTWGLQEITGDDLLLLNDIELSQESFTTEIVETWISSATPTLISLPQVVPSTPKAIPLKTTSSQKNSEADILQNLLKNFSN